ncbi:MAG: amino acid-binding protein [Firmicutes bacterium]|nr:amino acid-binding protein [Bacillota bacterium]
MGHRIIIEMHAASGAEARLWALVSQRRIDVTTASFEKNRHQNRIHATLEVELDVLGARRLMRQLERHHDIQHIALESGEPFASRVGQGPIAAQSRRMRITGKKGACL